MSKSEKQLTLFDKILKLEHTDSFEEICISLGCDRTKSAWPDEFGKCLLASLYKEKKIVTLSLFSGAGGLDIGFNDAGFDIIECVEIERRFCNTLELNSGNEKYFRHDNINCIDIREYHHNTLNRIEFIIGGPPCQTFSAAGRRANGVIGTSDNRGMLFKEYVRLLHEIKPKGFLFENVYGITGAQKGSAWEDILQEFSDAGYKLFYRILDAADFGVPQHRERIIIVGLKEGKFKFPRPTHGPDSPDKANYYSAEQAIESVILDTPEKEEGINGRYGHLLNDIPPGLNYSFYTEEMGHPYPIFAWRSKFSDFLYKADPCAPVRTVKAQGGQYTGPFHWHNRHFSIMEFKRLQTFPDSYSISGNRQTQLHQIGNSVPPQLARILAMAIRNQVFGTIFNFGIPYLEEHEELGFRKRKRLLTATYQKKAKAAIEKHATGINTIRSYSYQYSVIISNIFEYRKIDCNKADFNISVDWDEELNIIIYDARHQIKSKENSEFFSIDMFSNDISWNIGVNRIKVKSYSNKLLSYTAAWKAIEEELIRNNIKADLVQLCGYYQYNPKIKCQLTCICGNEFLFLTDIVNGKIIRKMLSNNDLALIWNISDDEVIEYAQKMRTLGYEIRNNMTNPQIKAGQWLIPYAFPTLTPQSVQLRKSLR